MKTYTFSEYRKMQEMSNMDKFLGHLEKNKTEYAKVVFILAVFVPKNSFAATADLGLGDTGAEILLLAMKFAKVGCAVKGVMNMVNEMLQGGDLKDAINEGGQYFIFYIILKYYPMIFDMIK